MHAPGHASRFGRFAFAFGGLLLGAIVAVPVAVVLPVESGLRHGTSPASDVLLRAAWGLALALPLLLGALLRGREAWPLLILAGVAWWGVREGHRLRINLGVLGFALTVLSFYFSSVLDKLGRSASNGVKRR